MRKRILRWLFGTDNIDDYRDLLGERAEHSKKCIDLINAHLKTLAESREEIILLRKLIRVCENHGIDVDEEIKHVDV